MNLSLLYYEVSIQLPIFQNNITVDGHYFSYRGRRPRSTNTADRQAPESSSLVSGGHSIRCAVHSWWWVIFLTSFDGHLAKRRYWSSRIKEVAFVYSQTSAITQSTEHSHLWLTFSSSFSTAFFKHLFVLASAMQATSFSSLNTHSLTAISRHSLFFVQLFCSWAAFSEEMRYWGKYDAGKGKQN